jgi:hypothetical protein
MFERWRTIQGFNQRYEVSDRGRIRRRDGMAMRTKVTKKGYAVARLRYRGKVMVRRVHRLVLLAFDPIADPEGMDVNHKNGIKEDNRMANLEWCTRAENNLHAFRTGLRVPVRTQGERNHFAQYGRDEIIGIRSAISAMAAKSLYPRVSIRHIYRIRSKRSWSHI